MQKEMFWGIVIQKIIEWKEGVGQSSGLALQDEDMLMFASSAF